MRRGDPVTGVGVPPDPGPNPDTTAVVAKDTLKRGASPHSSSVPALEPDPVAPPGRRVEEFTSLEGLSALADPWDLMARLLGLGPFGTLPWHMAWLESAVGRGATPRVMVGKQGDEIDGIAPFASVRESMLGLPVRAIRFIGGQESCRKSLLTQGNPGPFVSDLAESLVHERGPNWDILVLDDVPNDASWIPSFLVEVEARGLRGYRTADSTNYILELPDSYEVFHASLKPSLRRNLKRRARQISTVGQVGFERFRSNACTPERLESGAEIEAASWKAAEGIGVFRTAEGMAFHRRLVSAPMRGFEPDISFLTLDGKRIAFQYGFVEGASYFAYTTSFDRTYGAYSPGILLQDALIRDLIKDGVQTFDLLVGNDTYKEDLTQSTRLNHRLVVFNRTPYGWLLRQLYGIRHRLKAFLPDRSR